MADTFNTLTLSLDDGDVTIKLRSDLAPNHVARIAELANEGFYDGVPFHRVIPGFMAQGGDGGRGDGTGGSSKPKDRKSTRLNSSHIQKSRMPSSA